MLLFSDNDLILKLAACDLLAESLAALHVTAADVRVLPTAEPYFRRHKPLIQSYGPAAVQRAIAFAHAATPINTSPDPAEHALLTAVEGIDAGEAVLYAATKGIADFLVATGDKTSLRALAAAHTCRTITKRLGGRVLCLEQLVLRLLDVHGFDCVKERVVPHTSCDKSLAVAFYDQTVTEEKVRYALQANAIIPLRAKTGGLLVP